MIVGEISGSDLDFQNRSAPVFFVLGRALSEYRQLCANAQAFAMERLPRWSTD
jgi:hypothetical protein